MLGLVCRYLTGLVVMIALVAGALVLAIGQEVIYLRLNSRARRMGKSEVYVS